MGYPTIQPQLMAQMAPQLIMAPNGSIRSVHSVPMLTAAHAHSHAPSVAASTIGVAPTWDGEPCPVHHGHAHPHAHPQTLPLAALYGLNGGHMSMGPPSLGPPSVISGATTVRRARSVAEISNSGYPLHAPATPHLESKSFHGSMHHVGPVPAATMLRTGSLGPHHRLVVTENGAASTLPMRDPKNRSPLPPKDYDNGKDGGGLDCCSGHFVVVWIILGIITFGILLGIILKFTIAS